MNARWLKVQIIHFSEECCLSATRGHNHPVWARSGHPKGEVEANTRRPVCVDVEYSNLRSRLQKVAQADPVQHLGANAIEHCEADIGAILRGIDVNAKRSLSELCVDNVHDRLGDGAGVGIDCLDVYRRLLEQFDRGSLLTTKI